MESLVQQFSDAVSPMRTDAFADHSNSEAPSQPPHNAHASPPSSLVFNPEMDDDELPPSLLTASSFFASDPVKALSLDALTQGSWAHSSQPSPRAGSQTSLKRGLPTLRGLSAPLLPHSNATAHSSVSVRDTIGPEITSLRFDKSNSLTGSMEGLSIEFPSYLHSSSKAIAQKKPVIDLASLDVQRQAKQMSLRKFASNKAKDTPKFQAPAAEITDELPSSDLSLLRQREYALRTPTDAHARRPGLRGHKLSGPPKKPSQPSHTLREPSHMTDRSSTDTAKLATSNQSWDSTLSPTKGREFLPTKAELNSLANNIDSAVDEQCRRFSTTSASQPLVQRASLYSDHNYPTPLQTETSRLIDQLRELQASLASAHCPEPSPKPTSTTHRGTSSSQLIARMPTRFEHDDPDDGYRLRGRLIGWKLTTRARRRDLVGLLDQLHDQRRPEPATVSQTLPHRQRTAWEGSVMRQRFGKTSAILARSDIDKGGWRDLAPVDRVDILVTAHTQRPLTGEEMDRTLRASRQGRRPRDQQAAS